MMGMQHCLAFARRSTLTALAVLGLTGALVRQSPGALFTLVDNNSSIEVDTNASTNSYGWMVDNVTHLFEQSFWYRVGNAAESSLNSVADKQTNASDTNFNPGLDTLNVRYTVAGSFRVDVSYSLVGSSPGSGTSVITENVTILNLSAGTLDFHFFQYSDFDLAGTPGGDVASFTNLNAVRQADGAAAFSETVATTVPHHREIAIWPTTLNKLTDGLPTTLSDTPIGLQIGPDDLTWAYQWDFAIPVGGSVNIGIAKNIDSIPEPATFALAATSALGLGLAARRQRG